VLLSSGPDVSFVLTDLDNNGGTQVVFEKRAKGSVEVITNPAFSFCSTKSGGFEEYFCNALSLFTNNILTIVIVTTTTTTTVVFLR
jgi:hypothetical protein